MTTVKHKRLGILGILKEVYEDLKVYGFLGINNKRHLDSAIERVDNFIVHKELMKNLRNKGFTEEWENLLFNNKNLAWLRNDENLFVLVTKKFSGFFNEPSMNEEGVLWRTPSSLLSMNLSDENKTYLEKCMESDLDIKELGVSETELHDGKHYLVKFLIRNTKGETIAIVGFLETEKLKVKLDSDQLLSVLMELEKKKG